MSRRDDNIPKIVGASPILKFITNEEWESIKKKAIPAGKWHFERCERGVKPVKGEYDPNNPAHIRIEDVIKTKEF